jgi:hypothetical protein
MKKLLRPLSAILVALFSTTVLRAAPFTLSGSGGATLPGLAWGTAGNWSPAVLLGVNDNAVVTATGLVDVRSSTLGGAAEIQELSFTGASAVTLQNNSSSVAMVLSLNGGRGAGVPLISATGDVARTISGRGTNATPRSLGLQLKASGDSTGVTEQNLTDNRTVQTVRASVAAGVGARFLQLKITRP